ncbi:MAG: oligosaccharide flippase family protein [Bacteroidaceae bacterium]|nr:oligosaccharide flippase family protein [Bacteroidaceae bacterium]
MKEETQKESQSGYDRIIKYTGVFGGVQMLTNLITLVKGKLVAWLIGPAGMGIANVFNRALDLVGKTTDLGISFSAVKTIAENKEESASSDERLKDSLLVVRSWSLWLGIIGTIATFLLAPLFSRWSFEGDYSYTLSFRLLSLVVGFTAVANGERAIMKGTHLLKQLAANQMWIVLATLIIAIPVYFWLGLVGIVPVLVLTALSSMLLTCFFSCKVYPYKVNLFSRKVFQDGTYIVRLGVNYTIAGFFGSGALFLISAYLMDHGSAEDVGYYSNAVILASYLSMLVFSAVETDFFPRLSAVNNDAKTSARLVDQQTEVLVLLVCPLIVAFVVFLPVIIPLLLRRDFMPMLEVTQWAALALFFTALTRPMSFMSLSKGDSFTYLLQELFYDLFMGASVVLGYRYGGLHLAGIALFISAVFDWLLNTLITRVRYGYKANGRVFLFALLHAGLLAGTMCLLKMLHGWPYWIAGLALLLLTAGVSIYYLYKETNFLQQLVQKWKK